MQDDTTQPTQISKEEYVKFKQWVQDVHGTTRGHLRTEIENALREYRASDTSAEKLARIEDELTTVKEMVATPHADGGSVIESSESENTHAHAADTKPNPNAPRSEKVAWIVSKYYNRDGGSTTEDVIASQIQDEFGFGERTTAEYQQLVLNELGAQPHPAKDNLYAWGDTLREAKQEREEALESAVEDEMERVS